MVSLKERLTEVFESKLKESHINSKEMIASNTANFEDMGMANAAPGEFSQDEITDHANLENTASMSNDTDFSGKSNSGCEDCCSAKGVADKIDDAMTSLASDIVDISVKQDGEEEDEDEKKLMSLATESVKGSLFKAFKEKLSESRFGEESYKVYFWPFAGYELHPVEVEAYGEEQALEKAVAKLEEDGLVGFFADDVEDVENHPDLYLYVDATMEGANEPHYIDAQNLKIEKNEGALTTESAKNMVRAVKESGGDYAGPLSYVPDTRINIADVLKALKSKIGEGSEAVHVDEDFDPEGNKVWCVSQIDKKLLPDTLEVVNVTLKKDGTKYKVSGPSAGFPAWK